jgi:Pyrimidine dimer DNA glycosylase
VQTFLPFPDFSESARALDTARLGKQRVEALQVLRAIVIPTYGWQTHPAMQMWRGYVPALTRYALDMADEWTNQGHPDTTRPLIAEFAPEADVEGASLVVPSWLGNEALHLSHRSNLVRKAPEIYEPLFPGVPDDLPYVWPGPDPESVSGAGVDDAAARTSGPADSVLRAPTWIVRPRNAEEFDSWTTGGAIALGELSPRGKVTPKWQAQLEVFAALEPGTLVAVLAADSARLVRGTVVGPVQTFEDDGGDFVLRLPVEFGDEVTRTAFPYPALLQDPRTLFSV